MYECFKLVLVRHLSESLSICCLYILTIFQADPETDEVYAQMTLQPVPSVSTSMAQMTLQSDSD